MKKDAAKVFGVIVAGLAVVGLFIEGRHFLGLMNVDIALDMARIILAAALLYAGFSRTGQNNASGVLMAFGIVYLGLAIVGLLDREVGGLLPTGLTGFDIAFHLLVGALAIGLSVSPEKSVSRHHATR